MCPAHAGWDGSYTVEGTARRPLRYRERLIYVLPRLKLTGDSRSSQGGQTLDETMGGLMVRQCRSRKDEPKDYVSWYRWVERMSRTHRQKQCTQCGTWHVWARKQK